MDRLIAIVGGKLFLPASPQCIFLFLFFGESLYIDEWAHTRTHMLLLKILFAFLICLTIPSFVYESLYIDKYTHTHTHTTGFFTIRKFCLFS